MYKIIYHYKVVKHDISRLDKKSKERIKKAIESKLIESPEKYTDPLKHSLSRNRKLRVGNYRVIFKIDNNTIKILMIGHRKDVYKIVSGR